MKGHSCTNGRTDGRTDEDISAQCDRIKSKGACTRLPQALQKTAARPLAKTFTRHPAHELRKQKLMEADPQIRCPKTKGT